MLVYSVDFVVAKIVVILMAVLLSIGTMIGVFVFQPMCKYRRVFPPVKIIDIDGCIFSLVAFGVLERLSPSNIDPFPCRVPVVL
jgi:hypothetical protein